MKPKQLKKIRKQARQSSAAPSYIKQLLKYRDTFSNFGEIVFLINNVIESDRLISRDLLPQQLPLLELPENIQDTIFEAIGKEHPMGDPVGDELWDKYSRALPKLDQLLRSYRDYLEDTYGMWAYISAPFINDLSKYIDGEPTLEIMAGNGYISKGLRAHDQNVIATDSLEWQKENQTGRHLVTDVEKLDALAALDKYQNQVQYVIMSWSPDGVPIDQEVLATMREKLPDATLICIGEQNGATNTSDFWKQVKLVDPEATKTLNQHYSNFDLIHDQVYLIK
ncbi:SAM-dependent methyltransferase [Pediococcus argentinicus]|uniref:SAM-dependent methyltransferase n=1 Tax=Pediococcus argentinicus TaxID=480391 RepID=UPI00338E8886